MRRRDPARPAARLHDRIHASTAAGQQRRSTSGCGNHGAGQGTHRGNAGRRRNPGATVPDVHAGTGANRHFTGSDGNHATHCPPTSVSPTPTPTSPPARPTTTATATSSSTRLRVTVSAIPSNPPKYDRHDWKHWADADGDCQDARQEVLVAESRTAVSYQTDRRCRVTSGQWLAPCTGTIVTDLGKLDIDHMVPLRNAHLSGAWAWSAAQRERYANHLADPQHLIAVTASANRSKGARGPEAWKPEDRSYWCQYAVDWTTIKDTWRLTVTPAERGAIAVMLDTRSNCDAAQGRPANDAFRVARAAAEDSPSRWCPAPVTAMATAPSARSDRRSVDEDLRKRLPGSLEIPDWRNSSPPKRGTRPGAVSGGNWGYPTTSATAHPQLVLRHK